MSYRSLSRWGPWFYCLYIRQLLIIRVIKLQTEDQTLQFLERGAGVSRGVVREVLNHRLCVAHPNIVQVCDSCLVSFRRICHVVALLRQHFCELSNVWGCSFAKFF